MIDTLMVIDASSKGEFEKLTLHRMPGALPFAGKYRLIDFALSNAKNANIRNVAIFPFGNYRSLQDHIGSGKRWDLDRKKDGLFILPPKHIHMPTETMLTFQRMHEHIEYFKRSSQTYVFFTQANIVWNLDIKTFMDQHVEHDADVSEIMHTDQRLRTFILKRSTLIGLIEDYASIPYKTLEDWISLAPQLDHQILYHEGYTRFITDNFNYLKANLAMLEFNIGRYVFNAERPIVSKEKSAPPVRYLMTADVKDSMVSSGSVIAGTVKHSLIGRDVFIDQGAVIENSIIMSNAKIMAGVTVKQAVIEKYSVIKDGAYLEGTLKDPYVSHKEQVITQETPLNICFVATESTPFVKTGGLGDVVNDLSRHLVIEGIKTSVVMPLFKEVKEKIIDRLEKVVELQISFHHKDIQTILHRMLYKGVQYYFIEAYPYFERDMLYGYHDDFERYGFFNVAFIACFEALEDINVVHIHDWHAGLIPCLLKEKYPDVKTMLTIHNIDYQGEFKPRSLPNELSRFNTPINFLEEAIKHVDLLTTVSPTYKDELKYPYYGKNMTPVLLQRERDFYGILNGLSSKHDPSSDALIHTPYSQETLHLKQENKAYLQKMAGLEEDPDALVIGMVSRITETKGFPIITPVLESFLEEHKKVQFVLLGTGDIPIIHTLQKIEAKYPTRMKCFIGFHAFVPNHIYAGADIFLMPSRVEPCGLSQMIAMKYGTLPLVRQTGGLKDTVQNFDPITKRGTGFSFFNYDSTSLWFTLDTAYHLYLNDKKTFQKLKIKAMEENFSLAKQARRMIELYHLVTGEKVTVTARLDV